MADIVRKQIVSVEGATVRERLQAMDDSAVVTAFLGEEERAFSELVTRYQTRLLNFVYRTIGDREKAEDLVQEVFIRVWQKLHTFAGQSSFGTWLHQIAMNECRDILRTRRRDVSLDDVPEERLAAPGEVAAPLGRRLGALVDELPPRQRSVLTLRVFGELPFAEIARAEGITENAAKVSFHHAVRRLQEWLGRRS